MSTTLWRRRRIRPAPSVSAARALDQMCDTIAAYQPSHQDVVNDLAGLVWRETCLLHARERKGLPLSEVQEADLTTLVSALYYLQQRAPGGGAVMSSLSPGEV